MGFEGSLEDESAVKTATLFGKEMVKASLHSVSGE
jgi:hypothetical protein